MSAGAASHRRSLRRAVGATASLAALLVSCGGGSDPPPATVVTFGFRMQGLPASEEFRVTTSSSQFIAQARAQLALPQAQRRLFPAGGLGAGNGGHNLAWSWHLTDATLTEAAIELCDGRPSMVEADLGYWLGTVKAFCPWSAYVHNEVQ